MPKKQWSDLSERTRTLIILGAIFEGILKVIALIDLVRRPASEIRGSKARWVSAVISINSLGAVPAAYLLYGRKPEPTR